MRGDFSNWRDERKQNLTGVLHQQGRVLLDGDWNAQTAITNDWQDTAGRDIIGSGVAAVPADQPNGFKVTSAVHDLANNNVQLKVTPGRVWADGLLAQLYGEPDPDSTSDVTRVAAYLKPPVQEPAADVSSIANGKRDAVILEVWREEINGFQLPDMLIEPALGGPDTTERVHTAMAFRLMRLADGDTCESIVGKLKDDFSKKGKLKVSLQPANVVGGDCPTVAGGGYTGFEHNLYRIEIADVTGGPAQFKWSQYGGGLVGRGHFEAGKVTIKANLQAITNSGLSSFYLEAVRYDPALGYWRVTYGAKATLSNDVLTLGATLFGTVPSNPQPTDTTFFRLWNDIALVQDFANKELPNKVGILLAFDAPAGSNYLPGDYWTFAVRAGEITNPEVLVSHEAPKGVHYHRAPLAVLSWANNQNVQQPIGDCRHIFQPLTRLVTCCSYRVGDGMHSWGDFDKIQDAINSLPAGGGEICVLPGEYKENLTITAGKKNITIKGCGVRSRIISATAANANASDPVIHVTESQNIRIESLAIFAHQKGVGVLLEGPDMQGPQGGTLRDIALEKLYIEAATRCAIEAHVGFFLSVKNCRILMNDVASPWPAVFVTADDALIENNVIQVQRSPGAAGSPPAASAGRGGLQLGGTSERVRVINNLIEAGIGNGITLGTLEQINVNGTVVGVTTGWVVNAFDPCDPCAPGNVYIPPPSGGNQPTYQSAGALYDILIERNRILDMGLNGIGVVAFFNLDAADEFITVEGLRIVGNEIRGCLKRPLANIDADMIDAMGYGGVALADVENLVIQHNLIEDNGPNHLEPMCGIFVLHAEGLDISDNRIINNGAKTNQPSHTAKDGRRGGINIVLAITPTVPTPIGGKLYPNQNGVPAAKVHDNVASQPLGQALSLTALGPVSVANNHFTSRGMVLKLNPPSPSFIAATVMILNLGMSNELYLQLTNFSGVLYGNGNPTAGPSVSGDAVLVPREGLDDKRIGQYLANGNVLFSDNRCDLNLLETGLGFALSSVAIFSLDDLGFHCNQCDCNLLDDYVIVQALLFGVSLRVSDNRFKEGMLNAIYSAMTIGFMNATTNNQSTHCLLVSGLIPSLKVESGNKALITGFIPSFCEQLKGGLGNAGFMIGGL